LTTVPAALAQLVWDERRSAELAELGHDPSAAARVVRVDRGYATLRAASGELRVATDHLDADPAVGDWLVVDGDGIVAVLERRTLLERRMPDDSSSSPVVAANVDVVVVANALDHPFSPRRLERFLLVAWESGATPLVLLTKADAHPDLGAAVAEAESAALGAPVLALSAHSGSGLDQLRARLAGSTAVLLGRSGAGKSTLVNALVGHDVAATAEVRRDGKGRHTTTHRELHVLACGGVLIDTPGLRAVLPHDMGLAAERAFGDIEEFAGGCRFVDCGHAGEPGCAVAAAVAGGELSRERFEAWQRAEHDRISFERRSDPAALSEQRRHYRSQSRSLRAARKKHWI
jgi:ribosome biogenesis GTPase